MAKSRRPHPLAKPRKRPPGSGQRASSRLTATNNHVALTAGGSTAQPRGRIYAVRLEFSSTPCTRCNTYLLRVRANSWVCEGCRLHEWAERKTALVQRLRETSATKEKAFASLEEERARLKRRYQAADKRAKNTRATGAQRGAAALESRLVQTVLRAADGRA